MKRLLILAAAAALSVLATACVTSKVEQLRQAPKAVVVLAGESVVILGRRQRGDRESEASFNNCVADSLRTRRLPIYSEQRFIDSLFPWLEPRTAPISAEALSALLEDPTIADRVKSTGVRFMVWIDGETEKIDGGGSVGCGISPAGGGCFGFGWWEKESKYDVSVWDVTTRAAVGKVTVNASGTSYMPAIVVPIPLIARTEAAACNGVATQVGELLSVGSVAGPRPSRPGATVNPNPPAKPQPPRPGEVLDRYHRGNRPSF